MKPTPYYAVIFTSIRTEIEDGYAQTNDLLMEKAKAYPGFLGQDAVREELGIAVSYWRTMEDIKAWKVDMDHMVAKARGRNEWYTYYRVRIAKVEYDMESGTREFSE